MTAAPLRKFDIDIDAVRRDFPALEVVPYGKPLIYLDSAASAQKPRAVIEAMSRFMATSYGNVRRGVHYMSALATEGFEESRKAVQRFVNAASADEIVFTHGGTEAINLVAESFVAPDLKPGDEIVLTQMEHHANIVPWHFLRERNGAVLRWARVTDDGVLDLDHLASLVSPRTRLIAVTHMSNVLGTVNPIAEVAARANGIPVLVDGCQGAVHLDVDVRTLGADFYVFCGHKLYGPTGIGVLWAKPAHLARMRPYQGGGDMIREVTQEAVTYAPPPARFEAGTPPIVEAIGLEAAIRYVENVGKPAIREHEHALLDHAHASLRALNDVRVIGTAPGKGPILTFDVSGAHAHDIATIMDREGVAVRAGHHCAQPLMQRFGVVATTRASFGVYNTVAEVDAFVTALDKARRLLT